MASNTENRQNEYWRAREEEALRQRITDEVEYQRRIDQIYADMLESCQSEIDRFYRKYAEEESISLAEAKKRVSRLDIEAYERKAERYVKEKNFSKEANAEMRLYNATMKINRLEMLKANIGLELISGHDELEKFMNDILQGRTEDELKRQAGILGDTIRDNAKAAHTIVNASFQNATFSERIWSYQDALKADLAKLLQSGMIQGKNPRVLAREIESKFGSSRYNAERLMRTELARVQTEAQRQSFEKMGFDEYTFHANSNCCGLCQDLNGKHIKIKDMMPGENAPPVHPSCRCSCSAYEDSKEYDAWLDFLANGGTTEEWNKMKASGKLPTANPTKQQTNFNSMKLSGIDKEYLTDIEKTFNGLMKDYPVKGLNVKTNKASAEFGHYTGGIKGTKKNGVQYAVRSNDICINKVYHKNMSKSSELHVANYKDRGSILANAKRTDLATIPHEYGHAIDEAYVLAKDPKMRAFADKYATAQKITISDVYEINDFNRSLSRSDHRLSKEIFDELQAEYGLSYGGTFSRINEEYGSYAASSISEFLAEAFANMRILDDADKTDFMRSFEKIFNRKFDETFGGE